MKSDEHIFLSLISIYMYIGIERFKVNQDLFVKLIMYLALSNLCIDRIFIFITLLTRGGITGVTGVVI